MMFFEILNLNRLLLLSIGFATEIGYHHFGCHRPKKTQRPKPVPEIFEAGRSPTTLITFILDFFLHQKLKEAVLFISNFVVEMFERLSQILENLETLSSISHAFLLSKNFF